MPVVPGQSGFERARVAVRERIVAAWDFLVRRAREAGVPLPRAFVGAGARRWWSRSSPSSSSCGAREGPRPAPAAMAEALGRAESLLARGELEPARAVLQQLQSQHPETARVHYLLGNLDYAQGDRERALDDYHDAIRLDGGYAQRSGAARQRARARSIAAPKGRAPWRCSPTTSASPRSPDLVDCAKTCRDERTRKKAAEAAIKIGGAALMAEEGKPANDEAADEVLERLRCGKSCRERKAAALELIGTGDKRYLDSLRAARDRRGGFLGLEQVNGCMRRDLDAAIRKLERQVMAKARVQEEGPCMPDAAARSMLTSLLLVFPLFVVYQIGVLSMPRRTTAPTWSRRRCCICSTATPARYLAVNVVLALAFLVLVLVLRRKNTFDPRLFVPVLFESAIYALTMGSLICFVMIDFLHVDPKLAIGLRHAAPTRRARRRRSSSSRSAPACTRSWSSASSWSAAASGSSSARFGLRRWLAIALAFAISSVLFSAAHHVIGGEPFRVGAFTYRILCGLVFATIFQTRGFAVAVYTHALYDIYVLLVRG